VQSILHMYCGYSEIIITTAFKSATRMRLVKSKNPDVCVMVNCKVYISAIALYHL
jgi:hypothetical protein